MIGLPSINIVFKQIGATAIQRGERGIVGLILKETTGKNLTIYDVTDIDETLSDDNKDYIKQSLKGYTHAPLRVEVCVIGTGDTVTDALDYFESVKIDYLAYPKATTQENTDIELWIKAMRTNECILVKAVLPKVVGDYEGIINFTQDGMVVGEKTYNASDYVSRIAGLICGTDLKISCTYAPLSEVVSIPTEKRRDTETRINNGEFVLYKEAGKIKVGRGITSLTTTNQDKGELFQKIKIVDTMDMITNDIRTTIRDYYIGKYANSYDNKLVLITAIDGYLDQLYLDGLIDKGHIVQIDVPTQRAYLKSIGVNVGEMTEQEIKEHNTRDKVFLKIQTKILDAIEMVDITFEI